MTFKTLRSAFHIIRVDANARLSSEVKKTLIVGNVRTAGPICDYFIPVYPS